MENNLIVISVKDLPYKKMNGVLRSLKINPDFVAKSIAANGQKYCRIRWQDYLVFSHKIKKIILLKKDGLFLFVGHSNNDETIVYNDDFSKSILKISCINSEEQSVSFNPKTNYFKKNKFGRINMFLDQIASFGIESLSEEQIKELDELSKKD